ncbi:MAG: Ig-like domain-containing protein [Mogibacterium sp.]|nr:Ig-like domain-containing protein [Mogibacterium sp.]
MNEIRKHRKANAMISFCACIAMLLTFTLAPLAQVYAASDADVKTGAGEQTAAAAAASGDSLTAAKGVYYFEPHEIPDIDLTDAYVYDDALLKGDSLAYNKSLATMSFELAVTSMSSQRDDYPNKSRNLRAYLEDNGFTDFEANQYYKEKMTTDTMGVACAHKKIVDNGKEYTLLVIAPRSAGYEAEWGGNFVINESADDTGDHAGFKNGKNIVLDHAKQYIKKYGISGDLKVWTAGYSRGAGVTNQVGAALINRPKEVLGDSIDLTPDNLYCYTFGTPKAASAIAGTEGDAADSKFAYIHNNWEPYDIVTVAPPAEFGFTRYGTNTQYASEKNKERMLRLLSELNEVVYGLYTNGGDPDGFTPKTIDMQALIGNREFKIADDPKSYMSKSQIDYMAMMEESINIAVSGDPEMKGRSGYYSGHYQQAMKDFCGYYFSHPSDGDLIVDGIKESRLGVPLVAFMYISYMTERYSDQTFDDETVEQVNLAIAQLEQVISEMKAAGEEIPAGLEANLEYMKNYIKKAQKWGAATEATRLVTAILYSAVIGQGLTKAGLPQEDPELYKRIISADEASAMSRLLTYLMLYDNRQTDKVISFTTVTQQMKHLATFMGNASSFMRPHNNEIILSWLKTNDANYDDYADVTEAQQAGYRRVFITDKGEGSLTAKLKDESGKTVAKIEDGQLVSRKDKWIGITASDQGDWLRLPIDKAYRVEIVSDKDTKLDLKASEYKIYDAQVVRDVTKDSRYNWSGIDLRQGDLIAMVVPKLEAAADGGYSLPSAADYYIEVSEAPADWGKDDDPADDETAASKQVLAIKGIAGGKTKVKFTWNKVKDAERCVIYMAKFNTAKKKYTLKKVKTVRAGKLSWTKSGLKKNTGYRFYAVAQKKVDGKYKTIAKSKTSYVVTGNQSGRYTNPKSLKLSKTKLSLTPGKSTAIKGTVKKAKSGKKLMTNRAAKLRFVSTNTAVAKVDSKGKVTAVKQGTCKIYVQTINGIWKTVSITVS